MILHIDHHSGVPAYRQLIEQIQRQIATGFLQPGDPMPSTRSLSAEINLNPMTISKAYSQLERDGILERQRGKPLTVAASPHNAASPVEAHKTLRQSLRDSASLAIQLQIPPAQAAALFQTLITESQQNA